MTRNESGNSLDAEDRQLVDLVTAVLVDPHVHTDTRMRLAWEITEILRSVDEDLYARSRREVHARVHEPQESHETDEIHV